MSEYAWKTMNGTVGSYGHGDYSGYLPKGSRPGKWLPKVEPVLCESGYHTCDDVMDCLIHYGPDLWRVEVRGECDRGDDKQSHQQMRLLEKNPYWTDENLRLFAVDCARQVAHLTENPALINACLDICVAYAEFGEEWAAALAAAWDAARAAARAAAWAAAWAAARDTARAATRAAAWAAAWATARDSARDATRAAAWATTRDGARAAQRELLLRYLNGEVGPLVEE